MSSCRVYIGRLSYQAKEKDVERFFRGFGRIRDINLKNGFGFVVRSSAPFLLVKHLNLNPSLLPWRHFVGI